MRTSRVLIALLCAVVLRAQTTKGILSAFVEPEASRAPLVGLFDGAKQSIDLYVFVLTDKEIIASLASAIRRGVKLRALIEPCPGGSCTSPLEDALTGCNALLNAGAQIKWANPAFTKTHAKMAVIDGGVALVSTINLEQQSFTTRRDYGLTTDDQGVIGDFQRAFAQDWQNDDPLKSCTQAPSDRKAGKGVQDYSVLITSPDQGRQKILGLIASAAISLRIEMEQVDSEDSRGIVPALVAAVKRGVRLQLLLARPSDHPPNQAVADAVNAARGEARFLQTLKLHAKIIVIDGQRLFIGSQNLTRDSLDDRRELGWVTSDPATVFCYTQVFSADWDAKSSVFPAGFCPSTAAASAAVVSSASYSSAGVAAESIALAFGTALTTGIAIATELPLPTILGGTTVKVKDSVGIERLAPLLYVSPQQIAFNVPTAAAVGAAVFTVAPATGAASTGYQQIRSVAPGLYSSDSSGRGPAAGQFVQVHADGSRTSGGTSSCDGRGNCVVVPIDLGGPDDQTFLVLYGTGIRGRSSLSSVGLKIGGVDLVVDYAGPQGEALGLDQINVRLPRTLANRGTLDVAVNVDGQAANVLQVSVK